MLLEKGRLPIFGKITPIDLDVKRFDFSTHAGHDELVNFAKECKAEDVILYHTDHKTSRPPLTKSLLELGINVHTPMNRETYIIE